MSCDLTRGDHRDIITTRVVSTTSVGLAIQTAAKLAANTARKLDLATLLVEALGGSDAVVTATEQQVIAVIRLQEANNGRSFV